MAGRGGSGFEGWESGIEGVREGEVIGGSGSPSMNIEEGYLIKHRLDRLAE